MSSPSLSVVIPTHNRREVLAANLTALAVQENAPLFEVLVVDDGSNDGTADWLAQADFPAYRLRWWSQAAQGPAVARNFAIQQASASRVLLLGDDTLPTQGTLATHCQADDDVGVQGLIEWDPSQPVTDVMHFLAPAGPQFYFVGMRDGEPIPYTGVLGSNLSAPTQWFLDDPFDEGFPNASGEDTELAYRWRAKGRHTIFSETAICWHRHHYGSITPFLQRQQRAGRAARYAVRLHPRLFLPMVLMPTLVGGRTLLRLAFGSRRNDPPIDRWDWLCRWHFLRGFLGT